MSKRTEQPAARKQPVDQPPDPAGHDLVRKPTGSQLPMPGRPLRDAHFVERRSDGYWLKQHRITVDRRKPTKEGKHAD